MQNSWWSISCQRRKWRIKKASQWLLLLLPKSWQKDVVVTFFSVSSFSKNKILQLRYSYVHRRTLCNYLAEVSSLPIEEVFSLSVPRTWQENESFVLTIRVLLRVCYNVGVDWNLLPKLGTVRTKLYKENSSFLSVCQHFQFLRQHLRALPCHRGSLFSTWCQKLVKKANIKCKRRWSLLGSSQLSLRY